MKLLKVKAYGSVKYALALMDSLFTDEVMARSCYTSTKKSTKPALPPKKVQLLEGAIYVHVH